MYVTFPAFSPQPEPDPFLCVSLVAVALTDSFALYSQYLESWSMLFWVVGGGAVMVAVIIAVLQGSCAISVLMALAIVMVVLQVTD